jgi:hypothetical protein
MSELITKSISMAKSVDKINPFGSENIITDINVYNAIIDEEDIKMAEKLPNSYISTTDGCICICFTYQSSRIMITNKNS